MQRGSKEAAFVLYVHLSCPPLASWRWCACTILEAVARCDASKTPVFWSLLASINLFRLLHVNTCDKSVQCYVRWTRLAISGAESAPATSTYTYMKLEPG